MMSNVLAATYPEQIQAVSLYSGVPAGCFLSSSGGVDQWNSSCASGQVSATPEAWGNVARDMYTGYNGTRPRMQIWHGSSDTTLNPENYKEEVKVRKAENPNPCFQFRYGGTGARGYSPCYPDMASYAGSGGAESALEPSLAYCVSNRCMNSDPEHCSNGRMSSASVKRPLLRLRTTRSRITRQIITVQMFKASMQRVWGIVCRLT